MRPRTLVTANLILLVGLAATARAEDGYEHGRLRFVEPGVSLQRATDVSAEEALANAPFLPGDRVWTDAEGRAEFQFPDGSVVRLDARSKLDYAGHEEDNGERIVLRLWSGSLMLRVRSRDVARFEVETPAGTVQGLERSVVRIDVDAGEARVSVYEGEAVFDDGRGSARLAAGERTYARWGQRAEEPQRFDTDEDDDFLQWDAERESEERASVREARYLPEELSPYAGELVAYGDWRYEDGVGEVWVPRVPFGWRPYWSGHWAWTPYGWTWVPTETWGWAPFHYGRWDYSVFLGWYWVPGRTWGPAWVSWAVGGGYIGWCPLGRHDRPVAGWGAGRGIAAHAVLRDRAGRTLDPWNVVRQGELGRRDVARLRVSPERIDPSVLQIAADARMRPTRDGLHLREGTAVPRAISTRPSPGDFVKELAVDNKTTIPAPWFRRGAVPRSEDIPRYSRQGTAGNSDGRTANERRPQGVATAPAPSQSQDGQRDRNATQRDPRPAPWFAPRDTGGQAGDDAQARPSQGAAERRAPQPRSEPAARPVERQDQPQSQPRAVGGSSSRPSGGNEGGARPRSGGEARPSSSGGGQSHGSSGQARSSSGGGGSHPSPHADAKPQNRRN